MLLSTSANIEGSIYKGIKNIEYTSKLDINEPSLKITPIFRILNDNGEMDNNYYNSIIVSIKVKNTIYLTYYHCLNYLNSDTRK